MNAIKRFLAFSEIATKVASVFPFMVTLAYCFFLRHIIDVRGSAVFFVAMLLFDMTTTMINNYIDLRESRERGYFSKPVMLSMIFGAAIVSALMGLYMSRIYGLAFFLAGLFCFIVGVGYTYGPTPISRSPYGEGISGVTMGFVIPYLVTAINAPGLVRITLNGWNNVAVLFDLAGLLKLGLVCVPLIFCIANIMLANNICDLESDIATRYTMPRHIGRVKAVRLFGALYALVYVAIIAACALRIIPWTCLFVLLTALPVYKNVKQFQAKQVKAETFVVSIRNFLLILAPYAVFMLLGALLR